MPPGQPVHRCHGCHLYRPCRAHAGRWYCVDCNPRMREGADENASSAASSAVATDGGTDDRDPLYHVRRGIRVADGEEEQILRDAHNQIVALRAPGGNSDR